MENKFKYFTATHCPYQFMAWACGWVGLCKEKGVISVCLNSILSFSLRNALQYGFKFHLPVSLPFCRHIIQCRCISQMYYAYC